MGYTQNLKMKEKLANTSKGTYIHKRWGSGGGWNMLYLYWGGGCKHSNCTI